MDFSAALMQLKQGKMVYRTFWQSSVRSLVLLPVSTYKVNGPPLQGPTATLPVPTPGVPGHVAFGITLTVQPYFMHRRTDGTLEPWCPNHQELLATDWEVAP